MIADIVTDLTTLGTATMDSLVSIFGSLLPVLLPLFVGVGIVTWLWLRAKSFGK